MYYTYINHNNKTINLNTKEQYLNNNDLIDTIADYVIKHENIEKAMYFMVNLNIKYKSLNNYKLEYHENIN